MVGGPELKDKIKTGSGHQFLFVCLFVSLYASFPVLMAATCMAEVLTMLRCVSFYLFVSLVAFSWPLIGQKGIS